MKLTLLILMYNRVWCCLGMALKYLLIYAVIQLMWNTHISHMIGEACDSFYMRNGLNNFESLFIRQIMLLCPFVFQHHSCCDNVRRGRVSPEGRISTQFFSSRGRGQLIIVPSSPGTECYSLITCTPVKRKCILSYQYSIKYKPFDVKHAFKLYYKCH